MPEELEVPTEHLHETIHEAAHGAHKSGEGQGFNMKVALSSAVLAVIAAIAALMAGHAANEAVIEQIDAANQWSYYQSKSIKSAVLSSKIDLLAALNRKGDAKDAEKLAEYKTEMEEIKKKAEEKEQASGAFMKHHVILARSVTFFQIAIALSAIAVLTKKRKLWLGSLGLGALGAVFFLVGIL
jgi:hypothetical protein